MKLRVRALGLAMGVLLGLVVSSATFISMAVGGRAQTIGNFGIVMWGYRVSLLGAFVAFAWGLLYGFIGGAILALLYNAFHKMLYKS